MNEANVRSHVLFVLPVLKAAGAERIVVELATRLPVHGFATSVLCLEDERETLGAELAAAKIPVDGLRLSRRRTIACAREIARRLPAQRPLIVHSHLFHANLAARLAYKRLEKKSRAGVHVVGTVHVAERRFRPWQFMLDRATAGFARAEVCVSRAVAEFQRDKTGLPAEFFRVIENGIDLQKFGPAPRLSGENRVVAVGRLDPQKDFSTLLRAWKIVSAAEPNARLTIAGDGPEAQELKQLAATLGLSNVEFPGFVTDVPALLKKARVYAQPSAWEGFGLTVAEAMATALPVVVSDADSLPELVAHERTGLVVPKGDASALARAILRLLSDRALSEKFGAAARAEAKARFSVERMVADYAAFFRGLIDPGNPSREC